jgi:epoxyqueuosine reductase
MMVSTNSIIIKEKAIELGFSACGIAPVQKLEEEEERLRFYLENNFQGTMDFMIRHFEKRLDPSKLVPGAKSVVVVLLNYFPNEKQSEKDPVVSKYAYGIDYHLVVKEKLRQLLHFIHSEIGHINGRIFTDSAPVLERAWGVKAGLGWIGKNGLLINKKLGSFFFIGELIIDMELDYDLDDKKGYCGNCTGCLDSCPTKALMKPYILDARRCISYLTIELKENIPGELKPFLKNQIFGCDICQDVCPWNHNIKPTIITEFNPGADFIKLDMEAWKEMDQEAFNKLFKSSSIKRAGFLKMKMNVDSINFQ